MPATILYWLSTPENYTGPRRSARLLSHQNNIVPDSDDNSNSDSDAYSVDDANSEDDAKKQDPAEPRPPGPINEQLACFQVLFM